MPEYQYNFVAERYGTQDLKELAQKLYEEESRSYPIIAIFAYTNSYEGTTEIKTCSDRAEIDELYSSPYCSSIRHLFGQT